MGIEQVIDFSKRPIIILGVNHSGTRVLVDILSALGSNGGDYNNEWHENKFFLQLHRELLGVQSDKEWTKAIFSRWKEGSIETPFEREKSVGKKIHSGLKYAYPSFRTKPWHWKCPTSALFIKFWRKMYPNAFYLHIDRDPLEVAHSLLARKQFRSVKSANAFYLNMEERIEEVANLNYLKVHYRNLPNEFDSLLEFLPFLDKEAISTARNLIRFKSKRWKSNNSLKENLWVVSVDIRIALARLKRKKFI